MGYLGLVLSAGGARAAYEAGVIHYIRTGLPKAVASKAFDVLCGSSAGAINTVGMAALAHDPVYQGENIRKLWMNLNQDHIYKRDFSTTAGFVMNSLTGIVRNLTTLNPFDLGNKKGPHLTAFFDTSPLQEHLKRIISFDQIQKNIDQNLVKGISITTTNTRSGRCELFMQKRKEVEYTGEYINHQVTLAVEHIMASAAIPVVFPSVKIGKTYYTDGGLRLFTPMSPAIQLGADRIIIIGLRHRASQEEMERYDNKEMTHPPSVAELMGRVMNGIFLDRIQFDLEQAQRINKIIDWSENVFGDDYIEKINKYLVKQKIIGDIASRGLRKLKYVEILPSEFVSSIFERWFNKAHKEGSFEFSSIEKLLTRLLDVNTDGAIEMLSYLTFSKDYLKELIDLGYEDAKRQRNRLIEIMDDDDETD